MGAFFAAGRTQGISIRQSPLFGILLLNLFLTFGLGGISIGGHLGGLVGGALAGWVLFDWAPKRRLPAGVSYAVCGARRGMRHLVHCWSAAVAQTVLSPLQIGFKADSTRALSARRLRFHTSRRTRPPTTAAERPAHPPREAQPLLPGEPGAPAPGPAEGEPAGAGDEADVADAHDLAGPPLGDLHAVGEPERPDLGVAVEGGADAAVEREVNRMASASTIQSTWRSMWRTDVPDLRRRCVDERC